jgi:hypothetical protein
LPPLVGSIKRVGLRGKRAGYLPIVATAATLACAALPWPDEPGVPVAMSRAANVQAEDAFLARLMADRGAAGRSAPVVTPGYQTEIRSFAEDLQAGKTSAAEARRSIERWGRAAFQRDVGSWVVSCTGGGMTVPSELVDMPSAVVAVAAAHFRPRSMTAEQCALLIVAVRGGESVPAVQTP